MLVQQRVPDDPGPGWGIHDLDLASMTYFGRGDRVLRAC